MGTEVNTLTEMKILAEDWSPEVGEEWVQGRGHPGSNVASMKKNRNAS